MNSRMNHSYPQAPNQASPEAAGLACRIDDLSRRITVVILISNLIQTQKTPMRIRAVKGMERKS